MRSFCSARLNLTKKYSFLPYSGCRNLPLNMNMKWPHVTAFRVSGSTISTLDMNNDAAQQYLGSLLGKRLRLHTTDMRTFIGDFKCTDNAWLQSAAFPLSRTDELCRSVMLSFQRLMNIVR